MDINKIQIVMQKWYLHSVDAAPLRNLRAAPKITNFTSKRESFYQLEVFFAASAHKESLQQSLHSFLETELPQLKFEIKAIDLADDSDKSSTLKNPFGLKIEKKAIPLVDQIICVASGKGGVGKSTVSSLLACSLHLKGQRVGLLDADLYGPSAARLFGLSPGTGLRFSESKRIQPFLSASFRIPILSFGSIAQEDEALIWRGPLASKMFQQFCYETDWGRLDTLVIDLPPGTGDLHITLLESLPIRKAILVTTPQDLSWIDAKKALTMFKQLQTPVAGAVVNMSLFPCEVCHHANHPFGEFDRHEFHKYGIEVVTELPLIKDLRMQSDHGQIENFAQSWHYTKSWAEFLEKVL